MFSVQFLFILILFLSVKLLSRNTFSTVCFVPSVEWKLRGRRIQVGEWCELGKESLLVTTALASRNHARTDCHQNAGFEVSAGMGLLSRWTLEWTGVVLADHLQFFLPRIFL